MVIFITHCTSTIYGATIQVNKFESDSPLLFKEEFFETVPRIKDPTETTSVLGGIETEITHGTGGTQTSDDSLALLPSRRCQLPRRWKKFGRRNSWRCVKCPRQNQWVYSNRQWVCRKNTSTILDLLENKESEYA